MAGMGAFFRPASRGAVRMMMRQTTLAGGVVGAAGGGGGAMPLAVRRWFASDMEVYDPSVGDEPGFLPRAQITERVLDVVKAFENVDPSKVTETSHLRNDLGIDSLSTVELLIAIEEEFMIEVPDGDADGVETIPDIINFIHNEPHAQ
ncbi:Acyl carrier protein 2, mitochondrial [Porphyridium purpureum]|uniref:Acyl carrier protein n=1 Tax=Porphyridium purpureum TaxID=35688 RepID=A0A5J4YX76_PORPP|nr:Acyl carrier protein 2, mitochondrial [Porphyridium purpureum]|eukprot:POR8552..scf209_3